MISERLLSLEKISTDVNVADALTKAVPGPKVVFSREGMGMSPAAFFSLCLAGITRPSPLLLAVPGVA